MHGALQCSRAFYLQLLQSRACSTSITELQKKLEREHRGLALKGVPVQGCGVGSSPPHGNDGGCLFGFDRGP